MICLSYHSIMAPPFSRYPLVLRLLLIGSMFVFNISVVSMLAAFLLNPLFGLDASALQGIPGTQTEVYAFLFLQTVSSLGGFALTAMMFSVLESGVVIKHLGIDVFPGFRALVLGMVAIIAAQFFIDWVVKMNRSIPLPPDLSFIKDSEEKIEEITKALLDFKDVTRFWVLTLVIAVIPAIAEEFFFRGLLMGDLIKGGIHPWISIVITSFVFAVIHLEFTHFFAIWILGIGLGFLYYSSGSLWLAIIAHFINNFMTVLFQYLINIGVISEQVEDASMPVYVSVLGLVVFIYSLWFLERNSADKQWGDSLSNYSEQ